MFSSRRDELLSELADLRFEHMKLQVQHSVLLKKWNDLVEEINQKGGKEFLNTGVIPRQRTGQLTKEVVKKLIILCHPDKHDGKQIAVEATQILLELRKTL